MIPVINAARQENSRRSVRIADMLRLPRSCPRKTKLASRREVCLPGRRLRKPEKKLRVALHAIRPAIRRLVMARRPRNDFRGSISGTAVLRLVSPPGLGFDPRPSGTRSRHPGPIERLNGVINAGLVD